MKAVILVQGGFHSLQRGLSTWMERGNEDWCNPRMVVLDAQDSDEVHILLEQVSQAIPTNKGTVLLGFLAPNDEEGDGFHGLILANEDGSIDKIQYPISARYY